MMEYSEYINEDTMVEVNVDFVNGITKAELQKKCKANGFVYSFSKNRYSDTLLLSGKSKEKIIRFLKGLGYGVDEILFV